MAYDESVADRRAFELLYSRWQPRWMRFATWLVRNEEDALDVTQEASLAIARTIHNLEPEPAASMGDLLALVDSNDQQMLALFYVYGLSVAELASVLEIPLGTGKSRLFHARGGLQRA